MAQKPQVGSRGASLKSLFPSARFFHAEDVWAKRCETKPERCRPGDLFVLTSAIDDVDAAAAKAFARGACGVVTERLLPLPAPQCLVSDVDWAYARLCDALAGTPGKHLLTIGVVGGHAKSMTAVAIAAVLRGNGLRTAYYCDLGASDGVAQGLPAIKHPTVSELTSWLSDARDATAAVAIAELSADMLRRCDAAALHPDLLVVTDGNDLMALERAVELLPEDGVIIAAADCPRLVRWLDRCSHAVLRYGLNHDGDITGMIFKREAGEMTLLVTAGDTTAAVNTKLTGKLLARAQLAAVAVGVLTGGKLETCVDGLQRLQRIPGRMHRIAACAGPTVFLDSANTAPRLKSAISALRGEITGKVTTVLVLSPDLSETDRANLARAAEQNSQRVILTTTSKHRKRFMAMVHDALDGVERPERMQWIAGQDTALETALNKAANHDAIVIVCPQGSLSAEQHRELLEGLAARVKHLERPATLPHPSLLAAS